MTEEERRRIEEEQYARAMTENRIKNLEDDLKKLSERVWLGERAIWGAVVYLAVKVAPFLLSGIGVK